MKRYISLILILTFILVSNSSKSQEIKSIDSLINLCAENNFINADILIMVGKKEYYKKTIGYRENENRIRF